MASYDSVHGMFPPSLLADRNGVGANNMSCQAFLLPYLEQAPLFSSINMAFATLESAFGPSIENRTARNTKLRVFLCPSDYQANALNSYRFNRGRFGSRGPRTGFDGPFSFQVFPSQASVTDGLSRTAFVSERICGSFDPTAHDVRRDVKHPVSNGVLWSQDSEFIPYCLSAADSGWDFTPGRFWLYASFGNTLYNHNGRPNDPRPSCSSPIAFDNGFGLLPPRSYHPGCVSVLFGDGHVEPISDGIDAKLWIALGTYNFGD
jgi:prepilin-type processing-associated H-X9-DG protein